MVLVVGRALLNIDPAVIEVLLDGKTICRSRLFYSTSLVLCTHTLLTHKTFATAKVVILHGEFLRKKVGLQALIGSHKRRKMMIKKETHQLDDGMRCNIFCTCVCEWKRCAATGQVV